MSIPDYSISIELIIDFFEQNFDEVFLAHNLITEFSIHDRGLIFLLVLVFHNAIGSCFNETHMVPFALDCP